MTVVQAASNLSVIALTLVSGCGKEHSESQRNEPQQQRDLTRKTGKFMELNPHRLCEILENIEKTGDLIPYKFDFKDLPDCQFTLEFHLRHLTERGLIDADVTGEPGRNRILVRSLTDAGREYLADERKRLSHLS